MINMELLKMTRLQCILMAGCFVRFVVQISGNYVMPTVTLESCEGVSANLRVDNMTSGGLIYVRTYQAFQVLATADGTMYYSCHFDDCGLNYNVKFTLIIQQKVVIQSNNDLHQTFICMKDISPALSVESTGTGDEDTSNITRFTYNPEADMTFSSNGQDLPGGSIVKLGRIIDISIALTNNIDDMFDISIRYCTMSTITLTDAYCPVHEDIFGAFTKLGMGNFTNTFEMFRPTTTLGGTLNVIFTCVLELCRDECTQGCVSSRRRRDEDSIFLDDGREVNDDNLYVGQMFTVVTEEEVEDEVDVPTDRPFCLQIIALTVIFGVLGALLLASIGLCSYVSISYLRHEPSSTTNGMTSNEKDETKANIKEHRPVSPQSSCSSMNEDQQTSAKTNTKSIDNGSKSIQSRNSQTTNLRDSLKIPTVSNSFRDGNENHGHKNDEDSDSPVLCTNKPRRRSRNIEIPLIHLQNFIAKIAPNTGAADDVIVYRGIKQDQVQTPDKGMSPDHTVHYENRKDS